MNELAYPVSGMNVSVSQDSEPGGMERFDQELGWLDETIGTLEAKLGPILSQYAEPSDKTTAPKPEPSSQFRARLEHMEVLRFRLGQIINRLDI